jgi:hypothetical protein
MRSLAIAVVLLASTRAHAMGSYRQLDLVAWSSDGASALLTSHRSSSMYSGEIYEYVLVGSDAKVEVFTFHDTHDAERPANEHVDRAACERAAGQATRALAARKFRGVTIRRDRCATAEREVVAIGDDAKREVAQSWVVAGRSPRDDGAIDAVQSVDKDWSTRHPRYLAMTTGKLVIALYRVAKDDTYPAEGAAFASTAAGFARIAELLM